MTTLELAEKIARAVLQEVDECEAWLLPHDEYFQPGGEWPTAGTELQVAVLKVLHDNDSWFVRNPTGDAWHEEAEERYEMVQPELFK